MSQRCNIRTYQRSSGGRHQGRHPADDLWIVQSTGSLHQMGHLAHDLMHRCIHRRDPLQREVQFQALVKIIRTLPARLLINEVAFGHRPWRGEKVLNRREEGLC